MDSKLAKAVGRNIQRAREAAGVSQAELARRLGRSRSNVHRWENGGPGAGSIENLVEIARQLRCDLAALLPGRAA